MSEFLSPFLLPSVIPRSLRVCIQLPLLDLRRTHIHISLGSRKSADNVLAYHRIIKRYRTQCVENIRPFRAPWLAPPKEKHRERNDGQAERIYFDQRNSQVVRVPHDDLENKPEQLHAEDKFRQFIRAALVHDVLDVNDRVGNHLVLETL